MMRVYSNAQALVLVLKLVLPPDSQSSPSVEQCRGAYRLPSSQQGHEQDCERRDAFLGRLNLAMAVLPAVKAGCHAEEAATKG